MEDEVNIPSFNDDMPEESNEIPSFDDASDDSESKGVDETLIDKIEEPKKKEEEKKEEGEKEEPSEEENPKEEEKPRYRTLKAKIGEDSLDIPKDATVKAIVDGKAEFPTVQELINNYSGKQAWESKFKTITEENLKIKHERETVQKHTEELMNQVDQVSGLIKGALEGKAHPLSALEYLIDLTGGNSYAYNKLLVESLAPFITDLNEMSEVERERTWLALENGYMKKSQAAEARKRQELESRKEQTSKFDKQRESLGVTQEQFSLAHQELKGINPEQKWEENEILEFIKVKPMYELADSVLAQFEDLVPHESRLGVLDELVGEIKRNPSITKEHLKSLLSEALDIESAPVDDLLEKASAMLPTKAPKNSKPKKEDEILTFEDWY